jgi:hypothetical protein
MVSRHIGDVDRATANASGRSMKPTIVMYGLEHIPIREQIQMLSQKTIMSIGEDVPRMATFYLWKEVI